MMPKDCQKGIMFYVTASKQTLNPFLKQYFNSNEALKFKIICEFYRPSQVHRGRVRDDDPVHFYDPDPA